MSWTGNKQVQFGWFLPYYAVIQWWQSSCIRYIIQKKYPYFLLAKGPCLWSTNPHELPTKNKVCPYVWNPNFGWFNPGESYFIPIFCWLTLLVFWFVNPHLEVQFDFLQVDVIHHSCRGLISKYPMKYHISPWNPMKSHKTPIQSH
jgi:hypothetical protein